MHSARRIDSAKNPRYRSARKLRERKERTRQGRFLIDGLREIRRALENGVSVVEVYVAVELATSDEAIALLRDIAARHLPQFEVPTSLWSRLAFGDRADGVVAVAQYPPSASESLDLGNAPLVIVLEQVEKPGNVGAVIRTADAVGVGCVILAGGSADVFNPNTIRASVGTVFSMPILQMTSHDAWEWIRQRNLQVQVARPDASTTVFDVDFRGPTAIVLGSEAHGVTSVWQQDGQPSFHVPMRGHGDSLNVSVTAAVILYEALRQRT